MSDHDRIRGGPLEPEDPSLLELDRVDGPVQRVSAGSPRTRLLGVVAVVALAVGAFALSDVRGDKPPDQEDEEDSELDLEPTVLQLAGPRDGNDSIGLPIQVEPAVGLVDGQSVAATSGGFVPLEGVGIVQCADALPEEPGDAIDLCNIDGFTSLTASTDGVASGTYDVRRILVTPRSGSVDCAVEVRRCFIAMGAINDYDRSGGFEIEFLLDAPATSGEDPAPPPAVVGPPSATVVPALDLEDGTVVRLSASGLVPGRRLEASQCSADPQVCWPLVGPDLDTYDPEGLVVTEGGYLDVPLQVWRFLPGPRPGTYVDCSVSTCQIRLSDDAVGDPLVLDFSDAAETPTGPIITVDPREDLAPGDVLTVTGGLFPPGAPVRLDLCTGDETGPSPRDCMRLLEADTAAGPDGAFVVEVIPPDSPCAATSACVITATTIRSDPYGRPTLAPAPVPLLFASD